MSLSLLQDLEARQLQGATEQERVNAIGLRDIMPTYIAAIAQEQHGRLPQFDGYWCGEEWQIVMITVRVKTAMGVAFEPGDIAIGKKGAIIGEWVCYSLRNGFDTQLSYGVCPQEQLSQFVRALANVLYGPIAFKPSAAVRVDSERMVVPCLSSTGYPGWFFDQHGVGWGEFSGTIPATCSFCQAKIYAGFRSDDKGFTCARHVQFTQASTL